MTDAGTAGADHINHLMQPFSFDSWEVYGEDRDMVQSSIGRGQPELFRKGSRSGLAIRAVKGGKKGFAVTNGTDDHSIRECAQHVLQNISFCSESGDLPEFCRQLEIRDNRKYYDPAIDDPDWHRNLPQSEEIWGLRSCAGTEITDRFFKAERIKRFVVNTNGADMNTEETLFTVAGKWRVDFPEKPLLYEDDASSRFDQSLSPGWSGPLCELVRCRPSRKPENAVQYAVDLILSPSAGRLLFSSVFSSCMGDLSFLDDPGINRVVQNELTMVDDRTIPEAPGSVIFDGGGYPGKRTVLFENGVFNRGQENSGSERKKRKSHEGNTDRDEQLVPCIMPGNFYIQNGNHLPGKLIESVKCGIWIYKLFTFMPESVSHKTSFGFEGLWILDGETGAPCSGVTDSITLRQWIGRISGLGDDLIINNRISVPTLKFSDMKVTVH